MPNIFKRLLIALRLRKPDPVKRPVDTTTSHYTAIHARITKEEAIGLASAINQGKVVPRGMVSERKSYNRISPSITDPAPLQINVPWSVGNLNTPEFLSAPEPVPLRSSGGGDFGGGGATSSWSEPEPSKSCSASSYSSSDSSSSYSSSDSSSSSSDSGSSCSSSE